MKRRKKHRRQQKRTLTQNTPLGGKRNLIEEKNILQQTPAWSFEVLDIEGPWGWNNDEVNAIFWTKMVPKLQSFETMTRAEISQAAGGRRHGNNHHFVNVEDLTRKAQKRLSEIRQDDIDAIFSFRLTARTRIYGIRESRIFKLLWYDPFHADNRKAVVPIST